VEDQLLVIAHALGHPVRLHVLRLVGETGMGVVAVAQAAGIAKATAHHHLGVLEAAALVERVRWKGRVFYRWGQTRWALADITMLGSSGEHSRNVPRASTLPTETGEHDL
jgi:DNA-binding transcriptional ArsR family regulator